MDYTQSFLKVANTHPEFKEALEIIKTNSKGDIWLIGGFVYRSIIQDIYGVQVSKDIDLDFIVETPTEINIPHGWKLEKNSFGSPKLIGQNYEIDYIPLHNIHSIVRRGLEPTINNFFTGTPLNIQAIAFDIAKNKVIGDVGMKSIQDKIIAINNADEAKNRAKMKGVTSRDLVKDSADQLGFTPVYLV